MKQFIVGDVVEICYPESEGKIEGLARITRIVPHNNKLLIEERFTTYFGDVLENSTPTGWPIGSEQAWMAEDLRHHHPVIEEDPL